MWIKVSILSILVTKGTMVVASQDSETPRVLNHDLLDMLNSCQWLKIELLIGITYLFVLKSKKNGINF
jgi:hypothetical protein